MVEENSRDEDRISGGVDPVAVAFDNNDMKPHMSVLGSSINGYIPCTASTAVAMKASPAASERVILQSEKEYLPASDVTEAMIKGATVRDKDTTIMAPFKSNLFGAAWVCAQQIPSREGYAWRLSVICLCLYLFYCHLFWVLARKTRRTGIYDSG